jgi:uncharacterized protein YjaZ
MKKKKINIYFYPYKSAKDILLAFFHNKLFSKKHPKNILNTKVTFQDFSSKNKTMTIAQAIKIITKLGVWGFCMTENSKNKSIHYWIKNKKNIVLIANLITHEYSHAVYGNSEKLACQCGLVASQAVKFLLKEKLIKI